MIFCCIKNSWRNVSANMGYAEIDVKHLKTVVDAVLDHLIEDLGILKVEVEEMEDFYWSCPPSERYDTTKKPSEWWTGRLSDDVGFAKLMRRGQSGDISYNLVHLAPLLRFIGEKIKR